MEHILFGFGAEIGRYPKMELFLYLLVFSLAVGTIGKAASENQIAGQYPALIRYRSYSVWWHKTVLRVLGISTLPVLLLFGIGAWILGPAKAARPAAEWLAALALWLAGMGSAALIQTVSIQFKHGYKIVFALFMSVEVVSLYQPWLPGSWLMYERSRPADGFSIWAVCLLQIAAQVLIGGFGYLLFKPKPNR